MDIQLSTIKKLSGRFVERFHVLIFVIVILGGLVVVVFLLNNIIITSSDTNGYSPSTDSATFDQATIDQIKQLKTRSEGSNQLDLSHGRTNPFVE